MDLDDKGLNQLMKDDPDRANKTMQALGVAGAQEMKKQQELLDRDTVVEFYRFQNSDEAIERNHWFYFKYFVPLAEETNYAGADLVASTAAVRQTKKFSDGKLKIDLDLG
jgi:hypothetical protein